MHTSTYSHVIKPCKAYIYIFTGACLLAASEVSLAANNFLEISSAASGKTLANSTTITREVWENIAGDNISSIPLNSPPTYTTQLTSLESPSNAGDNYGARIRAYLIPSVTGSYTFYIASDNRSQLWLSTTSSAENKRKIAEVTGYTMPREWNKYASQKSASIHLNAGQRYYIEVLHKEGTKDDNLAVGWTGPNISSISIITNTNLAPFETSSSGIPEAPPQTASGVTYSYYEGDWSLLPDFKRLTPQKVGNISNFDLSPRNRDDNFAFRYEGYIRILTDGVYTFYTTSDDGSKLYIGNTEVVDNDGLHSARERSRNIWLQAGVHPILVTFFDKTGREVLGVRYSGPGISKQIIPGTVLLRPINTPSTLDTEPPSIPTKLTASQITTTSFSLTWEPSADNVSVTGYEVYRDGTLIGSPVENSMDVTGLKEMTPYVMTVRARDAAGNRSQLSSPLSVTTAYSLRNPDNPSNTQAGLNFSYFEGDWNSLPDFKTLTPLKTGHVPNITLSPRSRDDYFAFEFNGFIQVPADGLYTFYTSSDDGSKLYIGNLMVVNNDGTHGVVEKSGKIGLKAGKHEITIAYFDKVGGESLQVRYDGPGIGKQLIPSAALSRIHIPDTIAPTAPTALKISNLTQTSFTLSWTASQDNVAVTGYEVFRNGVSIGQPSGTTFNVSGLAAGASYTITVRAGDAEGNWSAHSAQLKAVTIGKFPVAKNSVWKFNDEGVDLGSNWVQSSYNDAGWDAGPGTLGYGKTVATTLSYGPNSNAKHPTYYFRHTFKVDNTKEFTHLIFKIRRDDGAVVYLNGTEQFRSNMPDGPISYNTLAISAAGGEDEENYFTFKVASAQLIDGINTLAVSVHQVHGQSLDLYFDMEVYGEKEILTSDSNCNPDISDKIGCFTSVRPTAQKEILVLPKTHTFQQLAKSGVTKYTLGGTGTMPIGNDLTAYVAKNGSSKNGYLSVNHENTPGGISVLDISLDEQTLLWKVNDVRKIDFSPVVRTVRNCSGGVTPWGTVVSSEETSATGDANGDGYQDVGWNVEFDPATGQLMDYDGDGKPDKLWAMGRMIHEKVTVSADGMTVYQGEDGGSSCVYKYIPHKKGDLSSGTLYTLKRSTSDPARGEWVKVPNTTKSDRNNTSNLAASLGGTNWFNVEGIDIGPDGKIYFTSKVTGTIWRFKDNGDNVSEIEAWVTNVQYPIKHEGGVQFENFGVGIDNLAFDGEGNLWALQDGDRNHIWVIKPNHTPAKPQVEVFATIPIGAEPTGLTFTPDFKYGFFSVQHPNGNNTQTQLDASGKTITHNAPITLVFARNENLGTAALAQAQLKSSGTEGAYGDDLDIEIYPNPFKHHSEIKFYLTEKAQVKIELLSIAGNQAQIITESILDKGHYNFDINPEKRLYKGVYILRLTNGERTFTRKVVHVD